MAEGPKHTALVKLFHHSRELVCAVVQIALREDRAHQQARSAQAKAAERAALLPLIVPGNLADPGSEDLSHLGLALEVGTRQVAARKGQDSKRKKEKQGAVKVLRADVIWVFRVGKELILAVIIEPQTSEDTWKPTALVQYWAQEKDNLHVEGFKHCPVRVIVVTLDAAVARWAARGLHDDQLSFTPDVIHPGNIPKVTDAQEAAANPGLAVLSAAANPQSKEIVRAAADALKPLPEALRKVLSDILLTLVPEELRKMNAEFEEFTSDVAHAVRREEQAKYRKLEAKRREEEAKYREQIKELGRQLVLERFKNLSREDPTPEFIEHVNGLAQDALSKLIKAFNPDFLAALSLLRKPPRGGAPEQDAPQAKADSAKLEPPTEAATLTARKQPAESVGHDRQLILERFRNVKHEEPSAQIIAHVNGLASAGLEELLKSSDPDFLAGLS